MALKRTALPTAITVGGITYGVLQDDKYLNDKDAYGMCNFGETKIHVHTCLPEDRKGQVLIHELTHAILYEAGFPSEIHSKETLVDQIANTLFQVLKDNSFAFLHNLKLNDEMS